MKYLITLCIVTSLFAQERPTDFDGFSGGDKKRKERLEMMMVWRLTEELNLSPDQAEKFFPRFRAHRDQIDENKKVIRSLGRDIKEKLQNDEKITEKEIKSTVKKISELRKKQIDMETDFLFEMDNLLSPEQLANLGMFKQKMMKNVKNEFREHGPKSRRGSFPKKGMRGSKIKRGY